MERPAPMGGLAVKPVSEVIHHSHTAVWSQCIYTLTVYPLLKEHPKISVFLKNARV